MPSKAEELQAKLELMPARGCSPCAAFFTQPKKVTVPEDEWLQLLAARAEMNKRAKRQAKIIRNQSMQITQQHALIESLKKKLKKLT